MLRYTVEDMTCGHCVQTITRALTTLDPAAQVAIDLPSKTVEVTGEADGEAVAGAIREAGYTPIAATKDAAAATAGGSCCGHC
jgi:copper chaperone